MLHVFVTGTFTVFYSYWPG